MQSRRAGLLFLMCFAAAGSAGAQRPTSRLDSLDFSGVFFANFQYHADTGVTKGSNKFDVERIYLTFRMPVGDRLGVRVTTDIFQAQSPDGTVKGWLLRAKYAYLQYDYGTKPALSGSARFGIVPTVIIDHEENFWPRFIAQVVVDRSGLLSPADGGVATVVQLPGSRGELFAGVTNGPGYTSRESDRFKDYSTRLSLTPLAAHGGRLKNLTLTGWIYRGAVGSKFSNGGPGQIGPVGSALPRNRWGIFAGVRDAAFTAGAHYGGMSDASESGANTAASPRVLRDSAGRFASVYTTFKPARILSVSSRSPFGIVLRYDNFIANRATGTGSRLLIGGVTADLSERVKVSLDYKNQTPRNGAGVPITRIYFAHIAANF
jgi:hypothetical protein